MFTVMSAEQCWDLLGTHSFGRLAYRLVDEVHVVPLDYAVAGRSAYVRTHAGNKLLAAELLSDVALEIDSDEGGAAWSVVLRGRLRRLELPELPPAVDFPHRPWFSDLESEVVELVAETVEGRRFGAGVPA